MYLSDSIDKAVVGIRPLVQTRQSLKSRVFRNPLDTHINITLPLILPSPLGDSEL